jgi:hypothetical protein
MKTLRLICLLFVFSQSFTHAQTQKAGQTAKAEEQNPTDTQHARRSHAARCDAQLGAVCVLTLERLRREDHRHKHAPIGVKREHLVVWISGAEEQFKFDRFKRVKCGDETKEINDPDDKGPFDKSFGEDQFETVKYARVIGKVGNCYKHVIDVNHGKEKIDPHIIIEQAGT